MVGVVDQCFDSSIKMFYENGKALSLAWFDINNLYMVLFEREVRF